MVLPKLDYPGASFRRHTKGYYFLDLYDKKTKRRKQITLTDRYNLAEAYNEAKKLAVAWRDGEFDPWHDRKDDMPLKEAIKMFLKRCAQDGIRPETIARRKSALELFAADHPTALLSHITEEEVRAFVLAPHLAQWSQVAYRGKLHRFFTVAVEQGWTSTNPVAAVKRPKVDEKRPAFLSKEEYVLLQQTLEDRMSNDARSQSLTWLRDFIQLAVATGLRRNELVHLRWRDCDITAGKIHVTQYGRYRTKSGKDRTVPLFPMALEVLERRKRKGEQVIPSPSGAPLDARMVTRRFRDLRQAAGIRDEIHLHSLRDTFASWLASYGTSLRLLQDWLGHQSITTTEIYAWLLPTDTGRYAGAFELPTPVDAP